MFLAGTYNSAPADIQQELVAVNDETGKLVILKQMIEESELTPPGLIFVQDKLRACDLHAKLDRWGLKVGLLHSSMSTSERQSTLQQFRRGTVRQTARFLQHIFVALVSGMHRCAGPRHRLLRRSIGFKLRFSHV